MKRIVFPVILLCFLLVSASPPPSQKEGAIIIRSNSDLAAVASSGNGTFSNPYIITGHNISSDYYAILIENTTAWVVIVNNSLSARWGIYIRHACNIIVDNNNFSSWAVYGYYANFAICNVSCSLLVYCIHSTVNMSNASGYATLKSTEALIENSEISANVRYSTIYLSNVQLSGILYASEIYGNVNLAATGNHVYAEATITSDNSELNDLSGNVTMTGSATVTVADSLILRVNMTRLDIMPEEDDGFSFLTITGTVAGLPVIQLAGADLTVKGAFLVATGSVIRSQDSIVFCERTTVYATGGEVHGYTYSRIYANNTNVNISAKNSYVQVENISGGYIDLDNSSAYVNSSRISQISACSSDVQIFASWMTYLFGRRSWISVNDSIIEFVPTIKGGDYIPYNVYYRQYGGVDLDNDGYLDFAVYIPTWGYDYHPRSKPTYYTIDLEYTIKGPELVIEVYAAMPWERIPVHDFSYNVSGNYRTISVDGNTLTIDTGNHSVTVTVTIKNETLAVTSMTLSHEVMEITVKQGEDLATSVGIVIGINVLAAVVTELIRARRGY